MDILLEDLEFDILNIIEEATEIVADRDLN